MTKKVSISIPEDQIVKCVQALKKHHEITLAKNDTKDLIQEGSAMWLIFSLKTISESVSSVAKPIRIPVPNSIRELGKGVCVFTKDPQKEYKHRLLAIPGVTKVIGVSKLKKYPSFADKRLLCDSYDFFLADECIIPMLAKKLGTPFFKKKKQPVPCKLTGDVKKNIHMAVHESTYMFMNYGSCLAVCIANTDMGTDKIVENVVKAVPEIVDKIPKKWRNVQGIQMKTAESIALPLYQMDVGELVAPIVAPKGSEKVAPDSEGKPAKDENKKAGDKNGDDQKKKKRKSADVEQEVKKVKTLLPENSEKTLISSVPEKKKSIRATKKISTK